MKLTTALLLFIAVLSIQDARAQSVFSIIDLVVPADTSGPPPPAVSNGTPVWSRPRCPVVPSPTIYDWGTIPDGPFVGQVGYYDPRDPGSGYRGNVVADGNRVAVNSSRIHGTGCLAQLQFLAPPGTPIRARYTVAGTTATGTHSVSVSGGADLTWASTTAGESSGWLHAVSTSTIFPTLRVTTAPAGAYVLIELELRIGAQFDGSTIGARFGTTETHPNSTGALGRLSAYGSTSLADDQTSLQVDRLPPTTFGLVVAAQSRGVRLLQGGTLLLGDPITRYTNQIFATDAAGSASITLPLTQPMLGAPQGVIAPGETWHFQVWHRDGPSSNLTNGVTVSFEP